MNFDVMRGPWIDCHDVRGKTEKLGIRDLLLRAHELEGVHDISPLQEYGIYRLLTVVVMDICRPRTSADMEALLEEGCFDKSQIDDYIARCEKDGPCFNLFDAKKPFMQDAFNPEYDEEKCIKPVSTLLHDLPGGNNHIHFDHRLEDVHRLTYAECAKALCAVNVFCYGNRFYASSINGSPPIYVLVHGDNLYQTIILNCLSELADPISYASPGPCYRETRETIPGKELVSVSLLEGMTLKARRAHLINLDNGYVDKMYFQNGFNFVGYQMWHDPHTIIRDSGLTAKPEENKDTWRDLAAIFDRRNESSPPVVKQSLRITNSYNAQVVVYNLVTEDGAYKQWSRNILALPKHVILNDWEMDFVIGAISICEKSCSILEYSLACAQANKDITKGKFSKAERDKLDKHRKSTVTCQSVQRYFANTRKALFTKQIPTLAMSTLYDFEALYKQWLDAVCSAAREAFVWGSEHMGDSASMLKAIAQAERSLYMSLGMLKKEK